MGVVREEGDIVVNIIKTIQNNHKFFVERMKSEKATNIKKNVEESEKKKIYQFNQELFFFSSRQEAKLTSETSTLI